MGWGNCGTDSRGRPIGYVFPARCDHRWCFKKIDRGLAYACGGMHGDDEVSCEGYFCPKHLWSVEVKKEFDSYGRHISVCKKCLEHGIAEGLWIEDE